MHFLLFILKVFVHSHLKFILMRNKQTVLFSILSLTILIILNGCALHNGLTTNVNSHQTDVVLSQKNYKIIKYVEGDAKAKYILGIGGLNNKGLIAEARQKMLKNAGLIGKSRAVINETVEVQTKQILIYTEFRYIVSAYIVEFYDDLKNEPDVEENVYIPEKTPVEATISQKGLTGGINLVNAYNDYGYDYSPGAGFHLGYKAEFSKPNTIKNLFWETQLNATFLSGEMRSSWSNYDEVSLTLAVPLYIGYKLPLSKNLQFFGKTGPDLGLTIVRRYHYDQLHDNFTNYGLLLLPGLEVQVGFQFNSKIQVGLGHKWVLDYNEYESTKFFVSYML